MASPPLRETTDGSVTEGRELDELRERVRAGAAGHPFWVLAAVAAVGLLAGSLLRRRPTPESRLLEAAANSLDALADRLRVPTGSPDLASRGGAAHFVRSALGLWFNWALRQQLARQQDPSLAEVREPI